MKTIEVFAKTSVRRIKLVLAKDNLVSEDPFYVDVDNGSEVYYFKTLKSARNKFKRLKTEIAA